MNDVIVDLHGYAVATLRDTRLVEQLVREAWEMGAPSIAFIHGHGLGRAISRPFANTNTGALGIEVRRVCRHARELRRCVVRSSLNISDPGVTTIRLRPNPQPTRTALTALPELDYP